MSDAIKRRMESETGNPELLIDEGIAALHHEDIPHELKFQLAPILFAAKHYGAKGLTPPDHLFEPKQKLGDDNGTS